MREQLSIPVLICTIFKLALNRTTFYDAFELSFNNYVIYSNLFSSQW